MPVIEGGKHEVMRFVVIVERDPHDPSLWRYGLADSDGNLSGDVRRWRLDPDTGRGEPVDPPNAHLPTAVLLIRQASGRTRIVYDVGALMFPTVPPKPPPLLPKAPGGPDPPP